MQYAAFISYSRADKSKARRLHAALENAGLRTWMDAKNLQTGDSLTADIKQAISDAACFVVLLSPASTESKWVQREVEFALAAKKKRLVVAINEAEPTNAFDEDFRDLVRIDAGQRITASAKEQLIADVRSSERNRMPVVSVLNMKGGVGKTTLSYHLMGCMHERRKVSTLLIDLDPQHNLSQLMVPIGRMETAWQEGRSVMSIFEPSRVTGNTSPDTDLFSFNFDGVLAEPKQIAFPIKPHHPQRPRLDLVLGHFEVVKYSLTQAAAHRDRLVQNFEKFIAAAKSLYDLIVIDLNPGASFLTEIALDVSTHVLAPARPDRYSRRGLELLDRLFDKAYRLRASPQRLVIINGYQRSPSASLKTDQDEIVAEIRASKWPRVLESRIGMSDLLLARPRKSGGDDDLTHWMAHKTWHPGGQTIRRELQAASDELARELGI